jgi:hypothetical protein
MKRKVYKALVLEIPREAKWYHGYLDDRDDLRGKEIIVAEHGNKRFQESLSYSPNKYTCSSSLYVSKNHIQIIKEVGTKDSFSAIKYYGDTKSS